MTLEIRPWRNRGGHRSEIGRSSFLIECPFCQTVSRTYVWSLCGGGKRCEDKRCRAMFGSTGYAMKEVTNLRKRGIAFHNKPA